MTRPRSDRGRRRLLTLARVLLAERVEVRLLGTGLPSIWMVHMGEMRLTLALSGWTSNDWSAGASLELLGPATHLDAGTVDQLREYMLKSQRASSQVLIKATGLPKDALFSGLHRLAKEGQVIYDFTNELYRWREVMPWALSMETLGPPPVGRGTRRKSADLTARRDGRARAHCRQGGEHVGGGAVHRRSQLQPRQMQLLLFSRQVAHRPLPPSTGAAAGHQVR